MNNLTVTGNQNFMGKDIPVVLGGFGEGKKCISDRTIAENTWSASAGNQKIYRKKH